MEIDVRQRRDRLARRHRLAFETSGSDPLDIARDLVAYHATDPASVYLAAAVRSGFVAPDALDRALYDDRTLLRMLGMRRTLFVVPVELMPIVQAACTGSIAAQQRRSTMRMFAELAADIESWFAEAEADTLRELARRGEATTAELGKAIPKLRERTTVSHGKAYEATIGVGARVLFLLAADGKVVRGRPIKSWVSNYRWALTETWFAGRSVPAAPSADDAQLNLARRWLTTFGPGTLDDLKWWSGWTKSQTKRAVGKLGAVEVDIAGGVGLVLPDDLDPVPPVAPWTAFLPGLDPTVMGWSMRGRDWFLPEHCREAVYDRNGNIGPTVWWDGRIVGGWAQRKDGSVAYRLLEDVGSEATSTIDAYAGRLESWFGDVRVTPRFRTPLEKELAA